MNVTNDSEETISKQLSFKAGSRLRRQMLTDVLQAHDEAMGTGASDRTTALWSKAVTATAAAIVILTVGILLMQGGPEKRRPDSIQASSAETRLDLLTEISLERAFRRGGVDAIHDQCKRVLEMSAPQVTTPSVDRLLAELGANGESPGGTDIW